MKLELRNIRKRFGDKQVLKDVSFKTESGKAFGLLGRNGAGKTTTIRILMDVFSADRGEVLVDGDPTEYKFIRMGYLPEERGLYPKKKIIDQLVYFAMLKGMTKRQAVESVDIWLKRLGMSQFRNKRLGTLSKGNQQKIQLITALAHDPDVIILDEPFTGLDPVNAEALKEIVRSEIARDKIVIFSSHQMNYVEEFCDHIAILNGGKIVLNGDLKAIKRDYPRNRLIVSSSQSDEIMAKYRGESQRLDQDTILLSLASPDDKLATMRQLVKKWDIDEIKVREPSLNDIFVQYAKEQF
mgnify:FL=1